LRSEEDCFKIDVFDFETLEDLTVLEDEGPERGICEPEGILLAGVTPREPGPAFPEGVP
jgi:hypothetical protein